jgi:hypothetical protein
MRADGIAGEPRPHVPIGYAVLVAAAFLLLCTMNAAGYRYGASDQALYTPAVLRHLDPALFPRDAPLIDTQARLMLNDEFVAALARITRAPLQGLYLALYSITLVLLFCAALRLGSHFFRTRGALVALTAALTLRHAIAKTGTNSLEGYFHPRQLAFALGVLALAMFAERRHALVAVLLLFVAVMHTTTALWFGCWLGVATWVDRPAWRRGLLTAAGVVLCATLWMVWQGPLAGRLRVMDAEWLTVIGDKDYLFPLAWPPDAWMTNLIAIPIIIVAWRSRARAGLTVPGETALVAGALGLAAIFALWLPFDAMRVALAVQLQTSRVFWMLDFLATVYLVWGLAEGTGRTPGVARRAVVVACTIVALSTVRAVYTCFVEFPDRRIVAADVEHADWRGAMAWARATPPGTGWLADPAHAAIYGSSVRAAGHRDVLLDAMKDSALAMYDRRIAIRVAERRQALGTFAWDTADGARALAQRYGLDYLVTSRSVDLPVAYRAGSLTIYRLR